jgi:hypothetical protein
VLVDSSVFAIFALVEAVGERTEGANDLVVATVGVRVRTSVGRGDHEVDLALREWNALAVIPTQQQRLGFFATVSSDAKGRGEANRYIVSVPEPDGGSPHLQTGRAQSFCGAVRNLGEAIRVRAALAADGPSRSPIETDGDG